MPLGYPGTPGVLAHQCPVAREEQGSGIVPVDPVFMVEVHPAPQEQTMTLEHA